MIGKRIKELRLENSMTQRELAEKLGLTPKMISFYEKEERFPPYNILLKLSEIFNVSIDYLFGREAELTDKDKKEVEKEADKVREYIQASLMMSFTGKSQNEETLGKIMKALDYGIYLAKKEIKNKFMNKED